jgi:hypothetical protein
VPCDYVIDLENRLVRTRISGVVTHVELKSHQLRLMNDAAFKPEFSQLADLRDITRASVSADEVREFAGQTPFGPGTRRAVVAPGDVAYGLARMFASYREAAGGLDQVHVFRRLEDAEEWLGLSAPGARAAKI